MSDLSPIQRAVMAKQLRQDPPPFDLRSGRAEKLVTMQVESRVANLVLPNGQYVEAGEHLIEVYESQVEEVMACVERATKAELKAAHDHLARHQREVESEPGSPHHWVPAFAPSFREVTGRELKPLVSAEVVSRPDEEDAS